MFVIAYLMKHWKMSALDATRAVKAKWDACWPCDRFAFQLVEYEKELGAPAIQVPPRLSEHDECTACWRELP